MSKLVIVESPAKAKTIGKYLGSDYEVTASMGHIRDLPASQLGIDVEHGYTPQYISIKGKEKLIKELKSKAKHSDGVLLATDPDREGEAISWHLANILGLDPHEPNRVTFDEITKRVCRRAWPIPAPSTKTCSTPSRPAVCWTVWWAISSARSSGGRSAGACRPAVSRAWPSASSTTAKRRSRASSPKNTGMWMPPSAWGTRASRPAWPPTTRAKSCCRTPRPRPAPSKRGWKGPSTRWVS